MALTVEPAHLRLRRPRRALRGRALTVGLFVVVVAALAAGEHLLSDWLHGAGVGVVGDQPAYLSQAQAILRGTPHTSAVFQSDLARHYFSAFPPGTRMSPAVFESFNGPRGVVSPFEPGMALLIAPFLAVGGQTGAFVGFFAAEAAGLVLVHRRASTLCRLGWRAQVFLGVALLGPALAVAATQLYPDLISGIVLAAALVEVARWERDPTAAGRWSVAVAAVGAGVLPWLQVKNAAPAVVVAVAFAIVSWRRRRRWRPIVALAVTVGVSWALLGSYNVAYFGHLSGYPEPGTGWDHAGAVRTLALLFDRDQGLFVQLPSAMLGVIGAWAAARRVPSATLAALFGVGAILVLNGTYTGSPFGGVTPAGRFQWTAMPVCVAFGAFALERWQARGWALLRGAAVLAAVWCYQSRSLVGRAHAGQYFTQLSGWDPAAYPGWWPGLDHLLPEYVISPELFGRPGLGSLLVLAAAAALVCVPSTRLRGAWSAAGRPALLAGCGLVGLLAVAVAVDPGAGLPAKPLTYSGSAVGSPLVATTREVIGPVVPLQGVIRGTYRVTVTYRLSGAAAATLAVYCDAAATGGPPLRALRQALAPGERSVAVSVTCPASGAVAAGFQVPPRSDLRVHEVLLAKIAS
jgi:hypothetical protein